MHGHTYLTSTLMLCPPLATAASALDVVSNGPKQHRELTTMLKPPRTARRMISPALKTILENAFDPDARPAPSQHTATVAAASHVVPKSSSGPKQHRGPITVRTIRRTIPPALKAMLGDAPDPYTRYLLSPPEPTPAPVLGVVSNASGDPKQHRGPTTMPNPSRTARRTIPSALKAMLEDASNLDTRHLPSPPEPTSAQSGTLYR